MSEKELEQKITELTAEYHENAPNLTMTEAADLSARIKQARKDLQASLSKGAAPCALCDATPLVIKQPRMAGKLLTHVYEVGCTNIHHDEKGKPLPVNRVYAGNLAEAIEAWNEQQEELA